MKIKDVLIVFALSLMASVAFAAPKDSIDCQPFGKVSEGTSVELYRLTNAKGTEATITNYGGIVVSLKVHDRNGVLGDVALGYDHLQDYVKASPYFGALIGRYGNRIAKGHFELAGKAYQLALNDSPNALHGGVKGFDKVVWAAKPLLTKAGPMLELSYVSKDGEEGYPGRLSVKAVYTLTRENELRLDFTATTDKETIVNLTHHSYFNLAGEGNGDILSHLVTIRASKFTPVDKTLIPTGELRPVAGTPMDFRKPTAIGARIGDTYEQIQIGKTGYDHNWVIDKASGKLGWVAKVYEPTSGRAMEVFSTEPGLQFYSGNFLDGSNVGKGGKAYRFRTGFCMEPQHFPDSPNHANFPSVVLRPGETYKNTIIYRFSAGK
ncbi:MAG: aldose epimerase family protein [Verrucomicrobiota bacterium]